MNRLPKRFLFILPAAVLIVIGLFFTLKKPQEQEVTKIPFTEEVSSEQEKKSAKDKNEAVSHVMVDIKGSVNKPGVYQIDANARVNDAIQLAGGFTKDADESLINLAQKVQDEMVVTVPKLNEDGEPAMVQSAGTSQVSGEQKIRINQATQEDLEQLSGIGPSKAKAIMQYREENGQFQTADDLLNIPGIAEKTLENIRDEIQVP